MEVELASWRSRLSEVASKFDNVPSIDKYKLTPQIEGIHILMTELDDRIMMLRKECATS
jgi:hypothetical protein